MCPLCLFVCLSSYLSPSPDFPRTLQLNPANKRVPLTQFPIQARKWHPGHGTNGNDVNGLIESRVSSVDIVKKMAGYVWPKDRKEIKQRVVASLGLLVLAKMVNVSVPFIFKHTIDLLNEKGAMQLALDTPAAGAATTVFCLVLGCKSAERVPILQNLNSDLLLFLTILPRRHRTRRICLLQ